MGDTELSPGSSRVALSEKVNVPPSSINMGDAPRSSIKGSRIPSVNASTRKPTPSKSAASPRTFRQFIPPPLPMSPRTEVKPGASKTQIEDLRAMPFNKPTGAPGVTRASEVNDAASLILMPADEGAGSLFPTPSPCQLLNPPVLPPNDANTLGQVAAGAFGSPASIADNEEAKPSPVVDLPATEPLLALPTPTDAEMSTNSNIFPGFAAHLTPTMVLTAPPLAPQVSGLSILSATITPTAPLHTSTPYQLNPLHTSTPYQLNPLHTSTPYQLNPLPPPLETLEGASLTPLLPLEMAASPMTSNVNPPTNSKKNGSAAKTIPKNSPPSPRQSFAAQIVSVVEEILSDTPHRKRALLDTKRESLSNVPVLNPVQAGVLASPPPSSTRAVLSQPPLDLNIHVATTGTRSCLASPNASQIGVLNVQSSAFRALQAPGTTAATRGHEDLRELGPEQQPGLVVHPPGSSSPHLPAFALTDLLQLGPGLGSGLGGLSGALLPPGRDHLSSPSVNGHVPLTNIPPPPPSANALNVPAAVRTGVSPTRGYAPGRAGPPPSSAVVMAHTAVAIPEASQDKGGVSGGHQEALQDEEGHEISCHQGEQASAPARRISSTSPAFEKGGVVSHLMTAVRRGGAVGEPPSTAVRNVNHPLAAAAAGRSLPPAPLPPSSSRRSLLTAPGLLAMASEGGDASSPLCPQIPSLGASFILGLGAKQAISSAPRPSHPFAPGLSIHPYASAAAPSRKLARRSPDDEGGQVQVPKPRLSSFFPPPPAFSELSKLEASKETEEKKGDKEEAEMDLPLVGGVMSAGLQAEEESENLGERERERSVAGSIVPTSSPLSCNQTNEGHPEAPIISDPEDVKPISMTGSRRRARGARPREAPSSLPHPDAPQHAALDLAVTGLAAEEREPRAKRQKRGVKDQGSTGPSAPAPPPAALAPCPVNVPAVRRSKRRGAVGADESQLASETFVQKERKESQGLKANNSNLEDPDKPLRIQTRSSATVSKSREGESMVDEEQAVQMKPKRNKRDRAEEAVGDSGGVRTRARASKTK